MSQIYLGSMMLVGFNFPPLGFAFCNGQLLSISQNTALFSLLGNYYGGDGRTTFALPNLQGCAPVSQGQGPGLSDCPLGSGGGANAITLTTQQVPPHQHGVEAAKGSGNNSSPNGTSLAETQVYAPAGGGLSAMSAQALGGGYGSGQPHNNMMPYQALNWIIALQGVFPARG